MSAATQGRQNRGYLYPKQKANDHQPDYRGKFNADGKEFPVWGRVREKDGAPMIALSLADPASSASEASHGYLYPNKKAHDRQPDHRGKLSVEGKEWLVSGWVREKDGESMISLSLTDPATLLASASSGAGAPAQAPAPASAPAAPAPAPAPAAGIGNIFDDLPG